MIVHTCNSTTRRLKQENCKFVSVLGYKGSPYTRTCTHTHITDGEEGRIMLGRMDTMEYQSEGSLSFNRLFFHILNSCSLTLSVKIINFKLSSKVGIYF